ncbi:hypothetical protein [Deinococcus altitudinis]|uniref:hypothetical protein n=1 Tax=Deinococcus altitudinis TaxID=468914 RepID=UPI003891E431
MTPVSGAKPRQAKVVEEQCHCYRRYWPHQQVVLTVPVVQALLEQPEKVNHLSRAGGLLLGKVDREDILQINGMIPYPTNTGARVQDPADYVLGYLHSLQNEMGMPAAALRPVGYWATPTVRTFDQLQILRTLMPYQRFFNFLCEDILILTISYQRAKPVTVQARAGLLTEVPLGWRDLQLGLQEGSFNTTLVLDPQFPAGQKNDG